jgi:hypothetical protein
VRSGENLRWPGAREAHGFYCSRVRTERLSTAYCARSLDSERIGIGLSAGSDDNYFRCGVRSPSFLPVVRFEAPRAPSLADDWAAPPKNFNSCS